MNILEYMTPVNDKLTNIDQTTINVLDNDLYYILSVLEKIDYVVGQTFGPYSGYVARETRGKTNIANIKYTKDGLTTIGGLNFLNPTDLIIANAVSEMVLSIKEKSGDGSTTAIRMLYNLIRGAVTDIRYTLTKEKAYSYRINVPKVIAAILAEIKYYIEDNKSKAENYNDIRSVAYISLNNDPELIKPIDKLTEYMAEQNIPIDENLKIFSTVSDVKEVKLITRPGYKLAAPGFLLDTDRKEMNDVKLIFLHEVFDLTMQIPMEELHRFAQTNAFKNQEGKQQKIVYVVSEIERPVIDLIKRYRQVMYEEKSEELLYDIIEMDSIDRFYKAKREDICTLVNTDEIFIQDFIEKRKEVPEYVDEHGNVIHGDKFDNNSNRNLWKIKMYPKERIVGKDENGEDIKVTERDHTTGRSNLYSALSAQLKKSIPVDIIYIGGDDSLSVTLAAEPTEEQKARIDKHIEKLRELTTSDDREKVMDANIRIDNLSSKYYLIEIPLAGADQERLTTAYRDACMAINSSVRNGYHMGGSIGVYFAAIKAQLHFNKQQVNPDDEQAVLLKELSSYICGLIKDAYTIIIEKLLPNKSIQEGFISGYIDPTTCNFGKTRVISPVETDIETIKGALELFSSFYSSLALEFIDPNSALHAINISNRIKEELDRRDGIIKDEPVEQQPVKEEEPKEEVVEETEEERRIREQFEEFQRKQEEEKRARLPIAMAANVQPVVDPFTKRMDMSEVVKKEIEKYSPKQVSENITIAGYAGDPKNIGADIEQARRAKEQKIAEINRILAQQMNLNGVR